MGMEYSVRFEDPSWYMQHRALIVDRILGLPSYVERQGVGEECWLKDAGSGPWPFDVRVFVRSEVLSLEVLRARPRLRARCGLRDRVGRARFGLRNRV